MQIDMHFYGVYALARAAGIKPETAQTIAHASQFVDDAIHDEPILLDQQSAAIVPIMSSHTPLDLVDNSHSEDQWRVWISFHFLPGNDKDANSLDGKLVCEKNSALAQAVLTNALAYKKEPFGPHFAGVAAHVFADTFSHFGFVGITSDWNKIKEESIELKINVSGIQDYVWEKYRNFQDKLAASAAGKVLPLGHAGAATFPDRPYLNWQYEYAMGSRPPVKRQNVQDFLEAAEQLHAFFTNFVKDNPLHASPISSPWATISGKTQGVLQIEAQLDDRVNNWKKLIAANELFTSDTLDQTISYSKDEWGPANFAGTGRNPSEIDFSLWVKAARIHQYYVLNDLLPNSGILI